MSPLPDERPLSRRALVAKLEAEERLAHDYETAGHHDYARLLRRQAESVRMDLLIAEQEGR